jgi:hypothetical protein
MGDAASDLMVRVANGDPVAMVQAAQSSDPAVSSVGLQYLGRFIGTSTTANAAQQAFLDGQIPAALWKQATGQDPTQADFYTYIISGKVLAAGFIPGFGGMTRAMENGTVQFLDYGWDTNFDQVKGAVWTTVPGNWKTDAEHIDYAGLRAKCLASLQNAIKGGQITLPPGVTVPGITIPTLPEQQAAADVKAVNAGGPPAGWRSGAGPDGSSGWWATDGLFYPGATPWTGWVSGTGQSVNPLPLPSIYTGDTIPSLPPGPPQLMPQTPVYTGDAPSLEYATPGTATTTEQGGSILPSLGSNGLLIVGGLAAAWFLFGRNRGA